MAAATTERPSYEAPSLDGLGFAARHTVSHAHPTKLALDVLGLLWCAYFLFLGEPWFAFAAIVAFPAVGTILVRDVELKEIAAVAWGRVWLTLATSFLVIPLASGYAVILFGVWSHSAGILLAGVSMVTMIYGITIRDTFFS